MHIAVAAWLFLALRVILLGLERPLGKKTVSGYSTQVGGFIFFGIAALTLLPTLAVYSLFHRPESWTFMAYAALTSSLFMTPFVFYMKALKHGEVSVITPLYSLGTLLVFFLPILFQNEAFTWMKLGGALLIFAGVFFLMPGVNPLDSLRNIATDRGAQFIILNTTLIAVIRLIDNYSADFEPVFYAISCATFNGIFFMAAVLVSGKWREAVALYRERTKLVWVNGAVNGYAYFTLLLALGLGLDMSVAEPVSNTSMLIAVVLGHFMFRERIRARMFASVLMVLGVFLLVQG
ncbi:DMT family transporter [bacterium]|nr:DMT family transporter [bacterium]